MGEEKIEGLPILWTRRGANVIIHVLQLGLGDHRKDPWVDLLIGNGGVEYDLRDFTQGVDMAGEGFAMCDMVRLLLALGAPRDADDQIGKRNQQSIQQLLLEILQITDQQRCPFLLGKASGES